MNSICDECKYCDVSIVSSPCNNCMFGMVGSRMNFFKPLEEGERGKDVCSDNVNHPNHYTGKYECIDVMVETQGIEAAKNFCTCNAFKYLWRYNKKNGVEDVKKAAWYLNKFIELETEDKNE